MPEIAGIIALTTALAGAGATAYGIANQPSYGGSQPQQPVPTAAQNVQAEQQARIQQARQLNSQYAGIQDATSGGASPDYLASLGTISTGNPSIANTAVSSWLGLAPNAGLFGPTGSGLPTPGLGPSNSGPVGGFPGIGLSSSADGGFDFSRFLGSDPMGFGMGTGGGLGGGNRQLAFGGG